MSEPSPGRIHPDPDELTLVELLAFLLRYRNLFISLALVVALGAVVEGMFRTKLYLGTVNFMSQGSDGPATGALAIAQRLGVDVGGQGPGRSSEFFAGVLLSRKSLNAIADSQFVLETPGGPKVGTLAELYDLPRGELLLELMEGIRVQMGWDLGVFQVVAEARTPELAEQVADLLVEMLNDFNLSTRRTQAAEEARFVSERLAEARGELRQVEDELQHFLQQNRQFRNSPELTFEHDRLEREVQLRQSLVTQLALSFETARIEQVRNTPVITIIEGAEGSSRLKSRRFLLRTVGGLAVGVVLAFLLALIMEVFRRVGREEETAHAEEYHRLLREAKAEWRRLLPRQK